MSFRHAEPVEVHRAPEVTSAYAVRKDWDQGVKVWAGEGTVQPDKTYESFTPDRSTSQEKLTVFLPLSADVESTDRVLIRGHFFEVDGEPKRFTQTRLRHTRLSVWRAVR
jgi:hypothetical protein